jgi:integrase
MKKPRLKLVTPTTIFPAVIPRRRPNAHLRTREYLTPDEVEALMATVKANRHGHRDGTLVLITYRQGLRAAEVVDLRWSQVDLDNARLHVRRRHRRPAIRRQWARHGNQDRGQAKGRTRHHRADCRAGNGDYPRQQDRRDDKRPVCVLS